MEHGQQSDEPAPPRAPLLWKLLIIVMLAALVLAVAGVLIPVLNILAMIFLGVVFGIFLHDLCDWITRHAPLSYRQAYTMLVFLILVIVAAAINYVGQQIVQQIAELSQELDAAARQLSGRLRDSKFGEMLPSLNQMAETAVKSLPAAWQTAWILSWILAAVLVIGFVGLYTAFDPELYKQGLLKLAPPAHRHRTTDVLDGLHSAFARWLAGRLLSMSIVGVSTFVALWLLNVPLPFTLAVLAALLSFVPNFGPILAAVPQMLLALQTGTETVFYVLLFNVGMQTVESYFLTPIIQQYEITLPPALVIFAQLLMGVVVGVMGVIVAAPLAVALMILIQKLYLKDYLDDSRPESAKNGV